MALRIGFLGLGIMGGGMARRLLGAGFSLRVFNRERAKAAALAAAGASLADSPEAAAGNADVIISMVADDAASRRVWLGERGALLAAPRGAILIECSTLSLEWIGELAAAAKTQDCELVDAPVTGSKLAAANGELNFLVGASAAVLERIRPVLQPMSRSIVHLGPVGSGALTKLVNNFVCGAQLAALAEALAWIERSGLDRAKALAVMTEGAPGSPLVKLVSGRMTASDYTTNFKLALMAKDLSYALREAKAQGLDLTTAAPALQRFQAAIDAGHGDKDMAAVIEPLRRAK
jgi:3-hydroxyisobutyrate dehydrogenase